MRGYRGFLRELARTGSLRSLALQLRTGARHAMRQLLRRRQEGDPLARFFASYGADGIHPVSAAERSREHQAERCLVCGLCSIACAEAGGTPRLDPRDAVVAASRLAIDWRRLGLEGTVGDSCAACRACEPVCPQAIPIHRVQEALARSAVDPVSEALAGSARDAGPPAIG